jgi:hypothetical protein
VLARALNSTTICQISKKRKECMGTKSCRIAYSTFWWCGGVCLLKTKEIEEYVRTYTNEMKRLVSLVPEEKRLLLPDHVISNQEIEIYLTKETGVVVDYVGISKHQTIRTRYSDRCYDDIIFPPTKKEIPCSLGAPKLKPLLKSDNDKPILTLILQGDFNGITLLRVSGGGHFLLTIKK